MQSLVAQRATHTPLPSTPAYPGNRRVVVKDWHEYTGDAVANCEICEQPIECSSEQCRQCKTRICSGCSKIDGKQTRFNRMAKDYRDQGCWCGIDGKFNMKEFAARVATEQNLKRKRSPVNPFDFLLNAAINRPNLGINERYSLVPERVFTPLNQVPPAPFTLPSNELREPDSKKPKLMPINHLDHTTTVIIGSGIIGLLIAFKLATEADSTGTDLRIIVLDINEDACRLSSQQCAGVLSIDGMDNRWALLGLDFLERWQNLALSMDIDLDLSQPEVPRIDTKKTAALIMQRCKNLGVDFGFRIQPRGVSWDRHGRISSVEIDDSGAGRPTASISCSNLIIAAGPFTSSIYSTLFPNSNLALENHVHQVQKLDLKEVQSRAKEHGVAPITVSRPDDYKGMLTLMARSIEHTASVFMAHGEGGKISLGAQAALKHIPGNPLPLSKVASEYVVSVSESNMAKISRRNFTGNSLSAISTGTDGFPIIGKVPSKALGDSEGVFLAYGFGMYGTTLAPVVGQVIAQLVCGKEPALNLDDFKIVSAAEQKKRKGRGKGRAGAANSGPKGKGKPGGIAKKTVAIATRKVPARVAAKSKLLEGTKTQAAASAKSVPEGDVGTPASGTQEAAQQEKKKKKEKEKAAVANKTKPKATRKVRFDLTGETGPAEQAIVQPTAAKASKIGKDKPAQRAKRTKQTLTLKLSLPDKNEPQSKLLAKSKDTRKIPTSDPEIIDALAKAKSPSAAKVSDEARPKLILRLSPQKDKQQKKSVGAKPKPTFGFRSISALAAAVAKDVDKGIAKSKHKPMAPPFLFGAADGGKGKKSSVDAGAGANAGAEEKNEENSETVVVKGKGKQQATKKARPAAKAPVKAKAGPKTATAALQKRKQQAKDRDTKKNEGEDKGAHKGKAKGKGKDKA